VIHYRQRWQRRRRCRTRPLIIPASANEIHLGTSVGASHRTKQSTPLVSVTEDFEDHLYLAFLPPTTASRKSSYKSGRRRGVGGGGTMKGKKELCSLSTLGLATRSHRFNWLPNYTQLRSAVTLGSGRSGRRYPLRQVTPSYFQIELSRVPRASCIYSACNQATTKLHTASALGPLPRLSDIADTSVIEKRRKARSARGPSIVPRSLRVDIAGVCGVKKAESRGGGSPVTRFVPSPSLPPPTPPLSLSLSLALALALSLSLDIAAFTSRRFPYAELANRAPVVARSALVWLSP